MAVERKKEKQKTPAELAAEETTADETKDKDAEAGEKKPRATRQRKSPAKAAAKPRAQRRTGKKAEPEPVAGPEVEPAGERPTRATKKPARERPRRPADRRPASSERERPALSRPAVRAHAKYVRSSARKARLVCDHIRGKSVDEARAILNHTPRAVAHDLQKLLASAVANAENNHELVSDDLYVKEVYANEGPTLKRFRPRALGRATRIRKRTTHLSMILTPKESSQRGAP
jgi:ribosomal protein L22